MQCGGSGCYSIASSPLLSPLGIKTHFSEVGLRDAGSALLATLFFSRPSCAPFTLGRDLSVWCRGYLVPLASLDAARVPRRNETLRREATLLASLRAVASFLKLMPVPPHVLLCCLADYVTRLWRLAHLLDRLHMCLEHGHAGGVPLASLDAVSRSFEELGLHT